GQLNARGYLHSNISVSNFNFNNDSSRVELFFIINEGEPSYISLVKVEEADSILTENILHLFSYLEGKIFNKFLIEQTINEALNYLENNAYPFARMIIPSIYFYYDSLDENYYADITFQLNPEVKSTIDRIEIEGNTSTKDYVIIRELRLNASEKYSQQQINELPERLNRLRFFEPASVPEFYINSANEGVLLIKVKEKQTNNFDGIVGYIPARNENEKGYLTGLVNVSLRNLFGTGRAAAIRWQQFDRNSQELELRYLEPWMFDYPFNISGGLFQRKQDTIYVQRNLEASLEYLASGSISAGVSVSTESVIPVDRGDNMFTVYNSSSFTTGLNLKIDTRDDPYAPLGGVYFINSYSFSRKKIYGPAEFILPETETNINLQRITLDIEIFYELFQRQVVSLGLHGRELRGSFLEVSDLYRLGGTNTLRGYREDQFLGARTFWSNLEYRFLLSRRTYAFVFFDTGYFLRPADEERKILKQEDFKSGYGLGLNLESGLGVLGVSFALAEGDSFSEGKIHFGLINEF